MGDKTGIEWCDATWNPTTGCDRCSPGCDRCYALTMAARLKSMGQSAYQNDGDPRTSGPGFALTLHEDRLDQPLRWKRPRRIFVNSMSDLFHPEVPYEFVEKVFDVMRDARQHRFQVLTKRPQRMAEMLWRYYDCDHSGNPTASCENCAPHPNVQLGTSIENGKYAFRARYLRMAPAAVRFLSIEPLIGPVLWPEMRVPPPRQTLDLAEIDWVIVGGESGGEARPMHPEWARSVRDECVGREIPFLFKQWGAWRPVNKTPSDVLTRRGPEPEDGWRTLPGFRVVEPRWSCGLFYEGNAVMEKVSKHEAGRELDGRTWDEYPA